MGGCRSKRLRTEGGFRSTIESSGRRLVCHKRALEQYKVDIMAEVVNYIPKFSWAPLTFKRNGKVLYSLFFPPEPEPTTPTPIKEANDEMEENAKETIDLLVGDNA
ncbi:hypothetical protein PVK06_001433 [Gossypium arboreum]|nr:hypothetical protein PVK06_001433 [Gossypium arboreum]